MTYGNRVTKNLQKYLICFPALTCMFVQWRSQDFSTEGQSEGARRSNGGGGYGNGREMFENSFIKKFIFSTLNVIIRNRLYSGL